MRKFFGSSGLFWLNARLRSQDGDFRREADRMLLGIAIAGVAPHVFKHLVTASARIECSCMTGGMGFRVAMRDSEFLWSID